MISPETDTRIFIDGNKSTTNSYFFQKEKFQPYKQERVDVMSRSKLNTPKEEAMGFEHVVSSMLGGQNTVIDENYIQRRDFTGATTSSTGTSSSYLSVDAEPFELVSSKDSYQSDKTLIVGTVQRLMRSDPISLEEKGAIIHCMHTQSLRGALGDVLNEINSPKVVTDMECLR
jgi:hypothetical protein